MKRKRNENEKEIRKYFTQQSIKFVKDLLDFCKEKQIDPLIIAEVLNIATQGFIVSLVAGEKGLTKRDFKKLLENKELDFSKMVDVILKKEKNDEVTYRS